MAHTPNGLVPDIVRIEVRTYPHLGRRVSADAAFLINETTGAVTTLDGTVLGVTTFSPAEEWQRCQELQDAQRQACFAALPPERRMLDGQAFEKYRDYSEASLRLAIIAGAQYRRGAEVPAALETQVRLGDREVCAIEVQTRHLVDATLHARPCLFVYTDLGGAIVPVPGVLHTAPTRVLATQVPAAMRMTTRTTDLSAGR